MTIEIQDPLTCPLTSMPVVLCTVPWGEGPQYTGHITTNSKVGVSLTDDGEGEEIRGRSLCYPYRKTCVFRCSRCS